VQQLFSNYKGTSTTLVTLNNKAVTGQDSLYSSAVIDSAKKQLIIKIVNASATSRNIELSLGSLKGKTSKAQWVQLACSDKLAFNSLAHPDRIHPETRSLNWNYKNQVVNLEGLSVNVFVVPYVH
jgi:alpha-L-arabinofuranosidase